MHNEMENKTDETMNRRQSVNIITLFLVLIFGFAAASLIAPKRTFSETENRTLQTMPAPKADEVFSGKFGEKYEQYLSDQFPGRDGWIAVKTGVERAALRQDSKGVYFAADDYLIETHEGVFDTEQARAGIADLSAFLGQLPETCDSGHLTAMVVPNAVDILKDKLPPFAAPYDEEVYLEKIKDSLPDGVWYDAGDVLRRMAGEGEQVYYRTDHHWTTGAAFEVFADWAKGRGLGTFTAEDYNITAVSDTFEGTIAAKVAQTSVQDTIEIYEPVSASPLQVTYNGTETKDTVYAPDKLETRDQYAVFFGGNNAIVETRIRHSEPKRRSLLVLKDSYAHCFVPFTFSCFDRVDMVDLRYYNQPLEELMEEKQYTDILILYNAAGFAEDVSLAKLPGGA